jgi:hypothetical protein
MDGFVEVYGEGLGKAKVGRRQKKTASGCEPSGAFTYCMPKKKGARIALSHTPRKGEKADLLSDIIHYKSPSVKCFFRFFQYFFIPGRQEATSGSRIGGFGAY